MKVTHRHHIIPSYRGGTDEPENLVRVTIKQHAMFHFANWQLWGDRRDFWAWRGLAGLATHKECVTNAGAIALTDPKNREKATIARNRTFKSPGYVHPSTGKKFPKNSAIQRQRFGIENWRKLWFAIVDSIEKASNPKRWGRTRIQKQFGVSQTPVLLAYRKIQEGISFEEFISGK